MSNPVGVSAGETLLIKVGNGATPEVFTHPCLINTTRDITYTTNVTDTEVADCDNPSLPAAILRQAKSVDVTVTGAGKLNKSDCEYYAAWALSGVPKNVQVVQNETGANGGYTLSASMILKDFKHGGAAREYQDCSLTLVPTITPTIVLNA